MPKVIMYSSDHCPYCVRAKDLLARKGVVNLQQIRVDLDAAAKQRMIELTGRRTVPQIFIGDTHVGGCDDLYALEQKGELSALLAD